MTNLSSSTVEIRNDMRVAGLQRIRDNDKKTGLMSKRNEHYDNVKIKRRYSLAVEC